VSVKKVVYWLLFTAAVTLIGTITIYLVPKQFASSGPMVSFTVSAQDRLNIASDDVDFLAASPKYFMLIHEEDGERIEGLLQNPIPIGWEHKYYFVANQENVTTGEWYVEIGSDIRTRLTHDQSLEATHLLSRMAWAFPVAFPVLGILFLVWFFVTLVALGFRG
jgi:hypothetical protein